MADVDGQGRAVVAVGRVALIACGIIRPLALGASAVRRLELFAVVILAHL